MELRSGAATALLGALAGVGVMLLTSQATTNSTLRVAYVPSPRDFIVIEALQNYVVPPGRIFVPTAVGLNQWSASGAVSVGLYFNGIPMVATSVLISSDQSSMVPLAPGLSAGPGTVVSVDDIGAIGNPPVRVWGYLYQI